MSKLVSRFRFVLAAALCLAVLGPAARAQDAPSAKPDDNIGHRRHFHRHNPPHPRATDNTRFTTNRSGPDLPLPNEEDAFFFVVYGDRTGGPAVGVSVLADAVHDTNLLEPDFVMTVGDLVEGYNEHDQWMKQMTEFKGIMDQLICPWFPVAGNHDVYWRGPEGKKPAGEHEADYEMHFGPLWYAFEHKNCWFIALYTDEGDPDTGEKNFRKPECQHMSDAQFQWLDETLTRANDADHVFLFMHHPRWLKDNYGDDWDRVHKRLLEAGNVTAVFAGHIHYMRSDPKDGIEYVTLATVGGHQSGEVPSAGLLHQFHVVTVRKDHIALAAIPVGDVMDVRDITGDLVEETVTLTELEPEFGLPPIELDAAGAVTGSGSVEVRITNPVSRPIEVTLMPRSDDSRWTFGPDHLHGVIEPGQTKSYGFSTRRHSTVIDPAFCLPELVLNVDYLTPGARYPIPERNIDIPLRVDLPAPQPSATEHVLLLDGKNAAAVVPAAAFSVPDGPLTLECWFRANSFGRRVGLITKTENSDYGLFVSRGRPGFSIFVGDQYLEADAPEPMLETGRWHHVAGVYDGAQARLYIDGKQVATADRKGERRVNHLPLVIGADVNKAGNPTSNFDGEIDEVRLSTVARYAAESFTPVRRLETDGKTTLLFHMDGAVGPWAYDASPGGAHAQLRGHARIAPAD